jgi:hypothetical protein
VGGVSESPGVEDRNHLVVGTMDEQDGARRDLGDQAEWPDLPQFPCPGVEVGRETGIPDHAGGPGLGHEPAGVDRSLGKVGRRREGGDPLDPGVLPGCTERQGPARGEPAGPHGVHTWRLEEDIGGRFQVGQPAAEREVARRLGDPPEAEGQHHPAGVAGQAVGQLVVAAVGVPALDGLDREAVAEHQAVPAGTARRGRSGAGQVGGQ